jgi:integrase
MDSRKKEVWITAGRGIRYKEHPTRKHGRRPDRYWCIRYKLGGLSLTEAVGWWSEGVSKPRCEKILGVLRQNWRSGQGPRTYKEMRAAELTAKQIHVETVEKERKAGITLAEFWESQVLPEIELRYTKSNVTTADTRTRTWLGPLRDMPLSAVTTSGLEKMVIKPMLEAGMKPATVEAVIRLFSMIWHRGKSLGFYQGESPTATAKCPKTDNRRVRFLNPSEAKALLVALKTRSIDAHDMALLSLFTGLRAGECSALTWDDLNFEDGLIFAKDPKNRHNRHAYMTAEIASMLKRRLERRTESPFVFYGLRGGLNSNAAKLPFAEVIGALGFNEDVEDRRQRVVFHTLRHTFASWLVQRGHPLYTVSQLMGHRLLKMTERYAHLAPDTLRAASSRLNGFLK